MATAIPCRGGCTTITLSDLAFQQKQKKAGWSVAEILWWEGLCFYWDFTMLNMLVKWQQELTAASKFLNAFLLHLTLTLPLSGICKITKIDSRLRLNVWSFPLPFCCTLDSSSNDAGRAPTAYFFICMCERCMDC